jgi:hypothetical protein
VSDLLEELSGAPLADVAALVLLPVVRGVYALLVRIGVAEID